MVVPADDADLVVEVGRGGGGVPVGAVCLAEVRVLPVHGDDRRAEVGEGVLQVGFAGGRVDGEQVQGVLQGYAHALLAVGQVPGRYGLGDVAAELVGAVLLVDRAGAPGQQGGGHPVVAPLVEDGVIAILCRSGGEGRQQARVEGHVGVVGQVPLRQVEGSRAGLQHGGLQRAHAGEGPAGAVLPLVLHRGEHARGLEVEIGWVRQSSGALGEDRSVHMGKVDGRRNIAPDAHAPLPAAARGAVHAPGLVAGLPGLEPGAQRRPLGHRALGPGRPPVQQHPRRQQGEERRKQNETQDALGHDPPEKGPSYPNENQNNALKIVFYSI